MKMMKYLKKPILLILLFGLLSYPLAAQNLEGETFSIKLSNPNDPGSLEFQHLSGNVSVLAHSKSEVEITAVSRKTPKAPKVRDGMKSLTVNNLEYSVEEMNNIVFIKSWPRGPVDFEIKVPKKFNLKLKVINDGKIHVEDLEGEFELSNVNGPISMKNISGAVVADATNKDIKIDFRSISNSPMAFSSFNGDVDVTFPADLKADIKAKSQMGDVFSDFDMKVQADEGSKSQKDPSGTYKISRNDWIKARVNGGGAELVFQSFNGDILIRSKK